MFISSGMNKHGQATPRTQCIVWLALWLARQPNAFHALSKCGQYEFSFQAGHGLPYATVNTHAEADMSL